MSDKLKDRAARCVTHHAACDCREYAYRERIERLEGALRILFEEYDDRKSQWGDDYLWKKHEDVDAVEFARETLSDDGAGGECSECGGSGGFPPGPLVGVWMPIETAPRDGTVILLRKHMVNNNEVSAGFFDVNDDRWPWKFLDPGHNHINGVTDDKFGPQEWKPLVPEREEHRIPDKNLFRELKNSFNSMARDEYRVADEWDKSPDLIIASAQRRGRGGAFLEAAGLVREAAREALADDGEGGDKDTCPKCGTFHAHGMRGRCIHGCDPTPPQRQDARGEALDALDRIERGGVDREGPDRDIYAIRQALTEPAVPDAVRELPEKWEHEAELAHPRHKSYDEYNGGCRDAMEMCADELERALAQQGPAVPDACGWSLDDEGYYQTECGSEFVPPDCMSLDELPTVKYCANCGRRIRDDSPTPDADEREKDDG